jgi:glycopeptide antibiotics resistance protein
VEEPLPDARLRRFATIALLAYLAVLLALTFLPLPALSVGPTGVALDIELRPFHTIGRALELGSGSPQFRLLLGNIAAFVPLGVLLPFARRRWPSALAVVATGMALSWAIELGQLVASWAVGTAYRTTDIDDVILNTAGTAVGYAMAVALRRVRAQLAPERTLRRPR